MAAVANQQLQNQLLETQPTNREPRQHYISGIPCKEWFIDGEKILNEGLAKKRVGGTHIAKDVALGQAAGNPHAGGAAPAAAILATHVTASQQTYGEIMYLVESTSNLYRILGQDPFVNDAVLTWAHIDHFMQLDPTAEDIAQYNTEFNSKTFLNSVALHTNSMFMWKDFLWNMNNEKPPAMRKTNEELMRKYTHFNHPLICSKAMDIFDDNPANLQFPAVYPATIVPGGPAHPNAGNAHPQAGQRDPDKYSPTLHQRWLKIIQLNPGLIPDNVQVAHQLFEEAPLDMGMNQHQDLPLTVSIYHLLEAGFSVEQVRSINRRSQFPRCFGCGGVNHLAKRDGTYICPTPEGSVPNSILFAIRYPMSVVQPPSGKGSNHFGKGKGKGIKGIGRGRHNSSSSRGRGSGRGTHSVIDESTMNQLANSLREEEESTPPADVPSGSNDEPPSIEPDEQGYSIEELYSTVVEE